MGSSETGRMHSPAIVHLQREKMEPVVYQRGHVRKRFVLCFDGTGNKFSGTDADSNILKIYRMLDRNGDDQFHYYQPGIGTYVTKANGSLTRTSRIERCKSWYAKAKDSAIGTSFDSHVMAGYKFLMRYYTPGDDIYFFGFSRGAYTARFLAEMLDHVGLLSAGNEEMCQFAWKTFQKWQCRLEDTDDANKEKKRLLEFMCAFRETFSRPVEPIRFLGLFDTVNSVPQFENAWMQRSKFPYTARSSARVIRHAVAIDERRAKFRQDLISQTKPDKSMRYNHHQRRRQFKEAMHGGAFDGQNEKEGEESRGRRDTLAPPERYTNGHETSGVRSRSPSCSHDLASAATSVASFDVLRNHPSLEEGEQDIQEVWFPGCHADIGGGWPLDPGEDSALSHVPLVWMVREAMKAGLEFDEDKLEALNCYDDAEFDEVNYQSDIPPIVVDPGSPPLTSVSQEAHLESYTEGGNSTNRVNVANGINGSNSSSSANGANGTHAANGTNSANDVTKGLVDVNNVAPYHLQPPQTRFHQHLHSAMTRGRIHDVLQRNNGVGTMSVLSWNAMEYMPFRRMDLCADGSWRAITWPLPKGETRDMPANATIHCSVVRRMLADESYRPGNLIVGGGGRGRRLAPQHMGIGRWVVKSEEGHAVGECFVRLEPPVRREEEPCAHSNVLPGGPQGNYFSGR